MKAIRIVLVGLVLAYALVGCQCIPGLEGAQIGAPETGVNPDPPR
jgi:hypothetical protein